MSRSPSSTTVDSDRLLHPTPGGGGKCPVDHETRSLWKLFGGSSSSGDNNGKERGGAAGGGKETASASAASVTSGVPVVASLEEAAKYAQTPQPGQKLPLSTHRMESTIPRSNSSTSSPDRARPLPAHQIRVTSNTSSSDDGDNNNTNHNKNSTWIYPSEQQVYNAMQRKGWNTIEEEAIPSFLQIHNSVNERGWKQIQQWEQPPPQQHSPTATTHTNISTSTSTTELELSRFEGRPKELSPKAWFLSTFGFRKPPFDRHDWYIVHKTTTTPNVNDRNTNTPLGDNNHNNNEVVVVSEEKRYILDFYMTEEGTNNNNRTMSMIPRVDIDVRPALDTPDAIRQRGTQFLRELFPGIAREYAERRPGLA